MDALKFKSAGMDTPCTVGDDVSGGFFIKRGTDQFYSAETAISLSGADAVRLRDWLNAKYPAQPSAKDGVVCVEVSGLTGTGKSAVAGEIEVAMLALGLEVQWIEGDSEKRLNHADFAGQLELYKPRVEIRERNIARPAVRGAEHA